MASRAPPSLQQLASRTRKADSNKSINIAEQSGRKFVAIVCGDVEYLIHVPKRAMNALGDSK